MKSWQANKHPYVFSDTTIIFTQLFCILRIGVKNIFNVIYGAVVPS